MDGFGGVPLCMKSGYTPFPRPDLGMDSTDFESVWTEIDNKQGKNQGRHQHEETGVENGGGLGAKPQKNFS